MSLPHKRARLESLLLNNNYLTTEQTSAGREFSSAATSEALLATLPYHLGQKTCRQKKFIDFKVKY